MKREMWLKGIVLTVITALLASGCSLWKSGESGSRIDPPPDDLNVMADELMTETDSTEKETAGTSAEPAEETASVTLYVEDAEGFVVPMDVNIPFVEGIARETLKYMVQGGPVESMLPDGFSALLPEGTGINGMNIKPDEKLAIVDFTREFTHYPEKKERKILESVVWTLTDFDTVDRVQLWVDGIPLKEMPVGGTPLHEPLSRTMGINLEQAKGVNLNLSTPVTLYFLNETASGETYFVPVTRMIPETPNVAEAAMKELIRGPLDSALDSVIPADAQVVNVAASDQQVDVYFSEAVLDGNEQVPAAALQSSLLSLTENTGAPRVRFHVDGHARVVSTDEVDYNAPVSRPEEINPLGI